VAAERHGAVVQVHDPARAALEGGVPRHLPEMGARRVPRRACLLLRQVRRSPALPDHTLGATPLLLPCI
jgi:hypothetical protein